MSKAGNLARHGLERRWCALPTEKGQDMNYSILIYETPDDFASRTDPARAQKAWERWPPYFKALQDAGIYVSGAGLEPPGTATTVALRKGERRVQDGPYADTKEQLGGFFIIDVPNLDTALDWAARCPAAPTGVIEVRPNMKPMGG
jgi:hypothetical protein